MQFRKKRIAVFRPELRKATVKVFPCFMEERKGSKIVLSGTVQAKARDIGKLDELDKKAPETRRLDLYGCMNFI